MVNAVTLIMTAASSECSNTAFVAAIHDSSALTGICVGMDTSRGIPDHKCPIAQILTDAP
jgi:hypothetical protein